jgi:hypothetical protein
MPVVSLQEINAFRGNFLIAFAGAALIIFAIKITPLLLPAKYYFNFSTIMGSGSEPFIVDTPAVTGRKLCAVLEKYDISSERFDSINCSLDYARDEQGSAPSRLSMQDRDRIYTIALQGDPALRNDIGAALQPPEAIVLTDADVAGIIASANSVNRAFNDLVKGYKAKLDPLVDAAIDAQLQASLAPYRPASAGEGEPPAEVGTNPVHAGLSDDARAKILAAHQRAAARLAQARLATALEPITKSAVDKVIKDSYDWEGVDYSLKDYYKRALSNEYIHKVLMEEFKTAGLDVKTEAEQQQLLFAEINKFSWFDYLVSILVRLAPVVIVGLLLGLLFGQGEILSAGVAGAAAAFLLTWPLMLMWDRLVTSDWHDKKTTFLLFYLAYIIVFFVTARTSAMVGAKLEGTGAGLLARSGAGSAPREPLSWRAITMNIVATVLANIAVYIGNVIIPLQAAAGE